MNKNANQINHRKIKNMEVIIIEKEAFQQLLKEVTLQVIKNCEEHFKQSKAEWIDAQEAKIILDIKSKSKLQQLRDNMQIEFSQFGKTIRYSRKSILDFLERNRICRR